MDKKEYLNEISATTQPTSKTKKGILSSKFFWIGLGSVILLIIIIIIGSLIGGSSTSIKDRIFALILHLDNVSGIIDEYQPKVKSSKLRSSSASLKSVLGQTNKDLTNYATEKYQYKPKSVSKSIINTETAAKDALYSDLFNAKINGDLDHTYAYKMAYEISYIKSQEDRIIKASSNSELKELLQFSQEGLSNLYDSFNNFSEAN